VNSGDGQAAKRADIMLSQMEHDFFTGKNKFSKPNLAHYNTVIYAYSRSIASRARELRNSGVNDNLIPKPKLSMLQTFVKCDTEIMSQLDILVAIPGRMRKMASFSNSSDVLPTTSGVHFA
jgi:hypothetical protein